MTEKADLDAIILSSPVCRLAFADGNEPYLVPVTFGYDGECLYFHTAATGRKLEFIERNNRVCFEFEKDIELKTDPERACKWTFAFETVIGYGAVEELVSTESKTRGLDAIMRHYSNETWEYEAAVLTRTRVWRVVIESMSGKRG